MKSQILFSEKNISKCRLLQSLPSMLNDNFCVHACVSMMRHAHFSGRFLQFELCLGKQIMSSVNCQGPDQHVHV